MKSTKNHRIHPAPNQRKSKETEGNQRKPKENRRIHPAPNQRKPKETEGNQMKSTKNHRIHPAPNQRKSKETEGNQRIPCYEEWMFQSKEFLWSMLSRSSAFWSTQRFVGPFSHEHILSWTYTYHIFWYFVILAFYGRYMRYSQSLPQWKVVFECIRYFYFLKIELGLGKR